MRNFKSNLFSAAICMLLLFNLNAKACSSYKVTAYGKTMVGSNYDAWLTDPRIWFETNGYGAAFSGARPEGQVYRPQTGLNEYGLAFVTLAAAPIENQPSPQGKKPIASRTNYLKEILHTCKNTDEAKAFIEQYDHSSLNGEVFLYADKSGKYLVVEPYNVIAGNDPDYVLANFCPSAFTDFNSIKQERYQKGIAFLKHKSDSSLAFCKSLSDTMHVCRKKMGDGTLLTSILDVQNGIIHLYFYHDYDHQVQFDLKAELAKGDHYIVIPPLFPQNKEYEKLAAFKTPMNSNGMRLTITGAAIFFMLSGFYFLISFFRNPTSPYRTIKLLLFLVNVILVFFMGILFLKENIFYFPAPYKDHSSTVLNIAAYIPFLLLLIGFPLVVINRKILSGSWKKFVAVLFSINNAAYLLLIGLFFYWGFYNVFS